MRRARELLAQVDRVDSEIVSESGSEIASESVSKSVPGRMVRGGRNFAPADGFAQYVEAEGLIERFLGMRERWRRAGPMSGQTVHQYIIASGRRQGDAKRLDYCRATTKCEIGVMAFPLEAIPSRRMRPEA